MTDHAADAMAKAQFRVLLEGLEKKSSYLHLEMGGFDRLRDAMKELFEHPPPHTDAEALRQHLTDRINGACETLDKMRALLPPEMQTLNWPD